MEDISIKQHFVGCDVSKETLDLAIFVPKCDYRGFPHIRVLNDSSGFKQAFAWMKKHGIKKASVVIGMEHTGAYSEAFAEWLHKQGIGFVFLHPLAVKQSFVTGRNKTDKVDSQYIADYVYTQREKLSFSKPEPAQIKRLRELQAERKMAVKARTMYRNLLTTRTDKNVVKRIQKTIAALTVQIRLIEADMMEFIDADENLKESYHLLVSIPGIGIVNAIATIVSTSNFTRFQTSRQYAKFCKVSPLNKESGISIRGGTHVPPQGHGELRSLLTDAARSAIVHDPQMNAFYNRKRSEGKSHGCVMNAVKFKLISRMFAVIKRKKPYVNTENYRSVR